MLALCQAEAAAREGAGRAAAAEMDEGGDVLPLPWRRRRQRGQQGRDLAIEVDRGELDGMARHDAAVEAVEPAAAAILPGAIVDDGVVADAVPPRLGEGRVGHLVH